MVLSKSPKEIPMMPPYILAIVASLDTFSVSISFGMLQVEKFIFILSAGIFAFVGVIVAQKIIYKNTVMNRGMIMKLAGGVLLVMGLLTLQNI